MFKVKFIEEAILLSTTVLSNSIRFKILNQSVALELKEVSV